MALAQKAASSSQAQQVPETPEMKQDSVKPGAEKKTVLAQLLDIDTSSMGLDSSASSSESKAVGAKRGPYAKDK